MNRDWLEGWPGQYRRMRRWQMRALEVLRNHKDADVDTLFDFTYAFFQSCWHLRDWLIATNAATRKDVDDFLHASSEMQLCRALCNSTKHLKLTQPHVDERPLIAREYRPASWGGGYEEFCLYSDERRPLSQLMAECVAEWDRFLVKRGLQP